MGLFLKAPAKIMHENNSYRIRCNIIPYNHITQGQPLFTHLFIYNRQTQVYKEQLSIND